MKFDCVVGNPPYGKNAALAVKFLNFARHLSDNIYFVLPRTFRKPSVLNRVNPELHLISDNHVADEVFPGTILTCWQHWERRLEPRDKIKTLTTHPDFEFVAKSDSDCAVGRVGGGPCGKTFTEDYEWRSVNTHYFLRVKSPDVIERLRALQAQFRAAAYQTVGLPSLSRHDLITIYVSSHSLDNESKL